MRTCVRKCLRVLIAFSVAVFLTAARAQTEPSVQNPQQDSGGSNCANGDLAACGSPLPSVPSPSSANGVGSFSSYPDTSPGAPNVPMSVYRDDAGGFDRTAGSRQHPSGPAKTQPLTEFQMLVAGSIGRIVPIYGTELFTNVPDTFQLAKFEPGHTVAPEEKSFPKRGLFAITGVAVGFTFGIMLALLQGSLLRMQENPATKDKLDLLKRSLWSGRTATPRQAKGSGDPAAPRTT